MRGLFLWKPVTVTTRRESLWRCILGHRIGFFLPIVFVVGVWCCCTSDLGEEGSTLLLFTGLEMSGEHGLSGCACYPCMPGNPSGSLCRVRELHCFRVFWTFGHLLCITVNLICSLRLFIEKLPKHRDYKSAVIPEKKDTVKVGLHFNCCPSKSFREAQTHSEI